MKVARSLAWVRGAIGLIAGRDASFSKPQKLWEREKWPSPKNLMIARSIPEHLIETINKLVRTSRQMLTEIGREPTPEELAAKLAMPLEKVRKLLKIAKEPISLKTAIGDAPV